MLLLLISPTTLSFHPNIHRGLSWMSVRANQNKVFPNLPPLDSCEESKLMPTAPFHPAKGNLFLKPSLIHFLFFLLLKGRILSCYEKRGKPGAISDPSGAEISVVTVCGKFLIVMRYKRIEEKGSEFYSFCFLLFFFPVGHKLDLLQHLSRCVTK